jgi:ribosomal protein S18 acetylase RimI-like enzyme
VTEPPLPRFRIEAVRSDHLRNRFDCGHPFLNTYLAQFARQNDKKRIASAYVMVPEAGNPVLGYYTLTASAITLEQLPSVMRQRLPRYPIPVARIGELAVDNSCKGQGFGSMLLLDALRRVVRACEAMAVWAIVVDPVDQQAATFYQHHGFEPLLESDTLFLTMIDAKAWLE